ncbi:hypothetical protein CBER1_06618 [Cercospora berteroae]|uniref:Uncharacterized protein n=1 Tax=Cercospora berteroae TaxID=357750 RepID=A0A2S6BUI4_9PEZI|nr:hypothetical protein CBER1_06618 [Cercospora berteroae]
MASMEELQQQWEQASAQISARGNASQYGQYQQGQPFPPPSQRGQHQLQHFPPQPQHEQAQAQRILDLETELLQMRSTWFEQARQDTQIMAEQKAQIEHLEAAKQGLETKCNDLKDANNGRLMRTLELILDSHDEVINQNNTIIRAVQQPDNSDPALQQRLQERDQTILQLREQNATNVTLMRQNKTSMRVHYEEHARATKQYRSEVLDEDVSPEFRLTRRFENADNWNQTFKLKDAWKAIVDKLVQKVQRQERQTAEKQSQIEEVQRQYEEKQRQIDEMKWQMEERSEQIIRLVTKCDRLETRCDMLKRGETEEDEVFPDTR